MRALTVDTPPDAPAGSVSHRQWTRRWPRYLGLGACALAATALFAHLIWVSSGSKRWEPAIEQEGVRVWTLKAPGSPLVKVKGTTRVRSKVAGIVKLLEDLDACKDANCYDGRVIESLPTAPGRYAAYVTFKFDMPGLKTRQFVLFQERYQEPGSNKVRMNLIAAPSTLAPDECCVRVEHLHNTWQITPLAHDQLDIEFTQDTDTGGLPYFLSNWALQRGTYEILRGLQDILNKDDYRLAQNHPVQELAAN